VAVVGGGTIGQTAICAALDFGSRVDAEVRHDHQREAADILGAGQATDHYDVVLEAAGTESALLRSIELCRPGGRVVLLGTYWDDVMMPGMAMALAEIDLVPASMYSTSESTRDIDVAARILADHPLIPKTIITHRFPLDGVVEAFATARDRSAGAIKVVLEP
jgi:threonine dehydrogenase-like Zn-dependent dehydrogenase